MESGIQASDKGTNTAYFRRIEAVVENYYLLHVNGKNSEIENIDII